MINEELVLLYKRGDKQALESLIKNNDGIIRKIANKFYGINKMIEFDDLIQVGVIGLIAAVKKYDPDMENAASFITYAFQYIKREIYSCVNGRSIKDVENNKFNNSCARLDAPLKEDAEMNLKDTLKDVDQGFENIEEKLYLKQLREDLEKAMGQENTLLEREILKMRYGWDCNPYTYTYIGSILEIPKGKVQRIEYKAIRKIRKCEWARDEYGKYFESIRNNPDIAIDDKIDFANKYFKGVI